MIISYDILARSAEYGKISERDVGENAIIRRSGMRFETSSYQIEGVGFISMINTVGLFGLMKMDTVVFTPLLVDAPLMSYDIMKLPGKDMILLELYDTMIEPLTLSLLAEVKEKYAFLPDRPVPDGWSKKMMLSESVDKIGRGILKDGDKMISEWLDAYFSLLSTTPKCECSQKREAVRRYTDGLYKEGGPAVDQFKKMMGEDNAIRFLAQYIFCSEAVI